MAIPSGIVSELFSVVQVVVVCIQRLVDEQLRALTAAVKEDQHLKENFVAKLKQAEDELSRKPARKRKR